MQGDIGGEILNQVVVRTKKSEILQKVKVAKSREKKYSRNIGLKPFKEVGKKRQRSLLMRVG